MKRSIGENAIANAVKQATPKKADLTAVTTKITQEKPAEKPVEKRIAKIGCYVKPSEKTAFIKLLGRKSESDAIREMILEFIKKNN